MVEVPTLPDFVKQLDELSDELELLGFPRLMSPEFIPIQYSNGIAKMEAVKVFDLLNSLMYALWVVIQSHHKIMRADDINLDHEYAKMKTDRSAVESEVCRLEAEIKKRDHELQNMSRELTSLQSDHSQCLVERKANEKKIRLLMSERQQYLKSVTTKIVIKDVEIDQLRTKLEESMGLGITRGSRKPTLAESLKEAAEERELLKSIIVKYQQINDALVEEHISLHEKTERNRAQCDDDEEDYDQRLGPVLDPPDVAQYETCE